MFRGLAGFVLFIAIALLGASSVCADEPEYTVPADAIEVANHTALLNAINSGSEINILLKDNVTMTSDITLSGTKTLNIYTPSGETRTIYSESSSRHFRITSANADITFNMTDGVIMDGNGTRGGIASTANNGKLTINGGVFQNCSAIDGSAIYSSGANNSLTVKGSTKFVDNDSSTGKGGGIYNGANTSQTIISDNVQLIRNKAGNNGGSIFTAGSLSISNNVKVLDGIGGGITGQGEIIISDNVLIHNNTRNGVRAASNNSITINDNAQISNNKSSGIYGNSGSIITINDNVKITGNGTAGEGGGIFGDGGAGGRIILNDDVWIDNNTAEFGGGVFFGGAAYGYTTELTINNNVKITNNKAAYGAGIYSSSNTVVNDDVVIADNMASYLGGGVLGDSGATITINGRVLIDHNTATNSGGGIHGTGFASFYNPIIINGDVRITNNEATIGGGIGATNFVFINDNAQITDNISSFRGGGIYSSRSIEVNDSATIARNKSQYGGGIYFDWADAEGHNIAINDAVSIIDNTATKDGGGIFTRELANLTISAAGVFSGNTASGYKYWMINKQAASGDSKTHMDNIHSTFFSTFTLDEEEISFTNAYNNYDVNYSGSAPTTGIVRIKYVEKDNTANILKTETASATLLQMYALTKNAVFNAFGVKWQPVLSEASPGASIRVLADADENTITVPCIEVITFAVAYDLNNGSGSISDSTEYQSGAVVTVSSTVPTRTGYKFKGWSRTGGAEPLVQPGTSFQIFDNIILTAVWELKSYDITFEGYPEETLKVDYGKEYGQLPVPTDTDNDFGGWFTKPNGEGDEVVSEVFADDDSPKHLYPKWTPKATSKHRIYYDLNGGIGTIEDLNNYAGGAKVTVTLTTPLRQDYDFLNWNTARAGTGITYNPGDTFNILSNVTLYAQWGALNEKTDNAASWGVIYNINGGQGDTPKDNTLYTGGQNLIVSPITPQREGYRFMGWNIEAGVMTVNRLIVSTIHTKAQPLETITLPKNLGSEIHLIAQWAQDKHYVFFVYADGTEKVAYELVIHGETADKPVNPLRKGYVFRGWYRNNAQWDFRTPIVEEIWLTAQWVADSDEAGNGIGAVVPGGSGSGGGGSSGSGSGSGGGSGGNASGSGGGSGGNASGSGSGTSGSGSGSGSGTSGSGSGSGSGLGGENDDNFPANAETKTDWIGKMREYDGEPGYRKHYINGYPDITIRPDGNLTRAEAVTMLYNILEPQYKDVYSNDFNDIDYDEWYYKPIVTMSHHGLVSGYPDGSFKPDKPITRAEFVTLIFNLDPASSTIGALPFTDIDDTHWAEEYVLHSYNRKWVSGNNGMFRPDDNIRRNESVVIINNILGRYGKYEQIIHEANIFTDLVNTHWSYIHMMEAATTKTYDTQTGNWLQVHHPVRVNR